MPAGDALGLLEAVFERCTDGFVELRPIRRHGGALSPEFFEITDLDTAAERAVELRGDVDVYFGVAPRTRRASGGDAVGQVPTIWADIDSAQALAALESFALKPSITVKSGTSGHVHAYWLLTEPVKPGRAEVLNRAVAERLGSDRQVVDRARILRLPGTLNHKAQPPAEVQLGPLANHRYSADELADELGVSAVDHRRDGAVLDKEQDPSAPVQGVLDRLAGIQRAGAGWKALCPAHDDHAPSLSIAEGDDGRCLLHCFAGCATEDVVGALGLEMGDLFTDRAKGRRASSRLIHRAEQAGIEVFRTPEGAAHAMVEVDQHRETWPLRSEGFALWLRRLHYEAVEEALPDDALGEAVATLEAKALFAADERRVYRRVAGVGERILVDLGDESWRAIEISSEGWEVVEDPDVHFVRDASALALPVPAPGGSIEELREFANCANEGSWLRLCAFLVMCFNPRGPYPVAYPTGEQGSAKSTLSRLICSLADPRVAPLQMGNPSIRDLAVIANSVWLVGFDNVSKVTPALSDALCQLATGGGYRTRQLYTDAEPFVLDLKRPVLLNGIGQVIERPDLLDRVALIELAPIPPESRRTEEEFLAAWEQARPRILGALLDGVVAALAGAGEVELEGFPRMADFARWGEAAGVAFGWSSGAFTAALEGSRQDLLEGSADAHPEIGALLSFMEERKEWDGSPSELLTALTDAADDAIAGSKVWPKRPDTLSKRLIEHAPLLRTHGLEVTRGREGGGNRKRFLRLTQARDAGTRGDT